MKDFRLCYVDPNAPWAWFTTAALDEQWGDDWDDVPYEHNAGAPYHWVGLRGKPPYELLKVAWDGDFEMPNSNTVNSPYSVQRINRGAVPWLITSRWRTAEPVIAIPAGTLFPDFVRLVEAAGGSVFLPRGLAL